MMGELSAIEVRARVLAWYDANRRDLPWRRTADPYRILVAEYLLQRTRIVSGTPYYERFVARFPSIQDLAAASLDDVLAVWEGLGFYRRARNLHAAARAIVERHGGQLPESFEELAALPGMGPYTAGAVASIAFGIPVPAVDGNVTRVIARLLRIPDDVTRAAAQRRIREIAASLVSPVRSLSARTPVSRSSRGRGGPVPRLTKSESLPPRPGRVRARRRGRSRPAGAPPGRAAPWRPRVAARRRAGPQRRTGGPRRCGSPPGRH